MILLDNRPAGLGPRVSAAHCPRRTYKPGAAVDSGHRDHRDHRERKITVRLAALQLLNAQLRDRFIGFPGAVPWIAIWGPARSGCRCLSLWGCSASGIGLFKHCAPWEQTPEMRALLGLNPEWRGRGTSKFLPVPGLLLCRKLYSVQQLAFPDMPSLLAAHAGASAVFIHFFPLNGGGRPKKFSTYPPTTVTPYFCSWIAPSRRWRHVFALGLPDRGGERPKQLSIDPIARVNAHLCSQNTRSQRRPCNFVFKRPAHSRRGRFLFSKRALTTGAVDFFNFNARSHAWEGVLKVFLGAHRRDRAGKCPFWAFTRGRVTPANFPWRQNLTTNNQKHHRQEL